MSFAQTGPNAMQVLPLLMEERSYKILEASVDRYNTGYDGRQPEIDRFCSLATKWYCEGFTSVGTDIGQKLTCASRQSAVFIDQQVGSPWSANVRFLEKHYETLLQMGQELDLESLGAAIRICAGQFVGALGAKQACAVTFVNAALDVPRFDYLLLENPHRSCPGFQPDAIN